MTYESLAVLFAGASLRPTPNPYDPSGKLKLAFAAQHASMVDGSNNPVIIPPYGVHLPPEPPTP